MRKQIIATLGNDPHLFFTAIHEAGHAVAASKLNLPIEYVTVAPDGIGAGRTVRVGSGTEVVLEHPENEIVMAYAGFAAQHNWFGKRKKANYKNEKDFDYAKYIADECISCEDAAAQSLLLRNLKKRAGRLTSTQRSWIKRVADTLCHLKTIGPETVAALRHTTILSLPDGEITWYDDEPFLRVGGKLVGGSTYLCKDDSGTFLFHSTRQVSK